jgi:hypothetical protein
MAEDCIDDPFTTGVVVKAGHGTGAPAHFPEAALNGVGRAGHSAVVGRTIEKTEQAVDIAFEAGDGPRRFRAPALGPGPVGLNGGRLRVCLLALARVAPELLIVAGHFPPEIRWRQFVQSL